MMDENAKRRLVGAAVLVALMVIFVPMLIDRGDEDDQLGEPIVIPNPPDFDSRFDSSVEPSVDEFNRPVPQPRAQAPADTAPRPSTGAQDLRPSPVRPEAIRPESGRPESAKPPPVPVEREPIRAVTPSPAPAPAQPAAPPSSTNPPRAAPLAKPPQQPEPRPPVAAGAVSWVVQVASLSVPDAATKLRDQLRAKGYPAFIEQAEIKDATFYRVRVGPESDRARADRMATAIGAITGGAPLVQQYR